MRVSEWGVIININVGVDASAATEVGIIFTKPDGTTLTVDSTDGVTVGAVPLTADCDVIYAADEYLIYTTVTGNIDQAGDWYVRGFVDTATTHLIGSNQLMKVLS